MARIDQYLRPLHPDYLCSWLVDGDNAVDPELEALLGATKAQDFANARNADGVGNFTYRNNWWTVFDPIDTADYYIGRPYWWRPTFTGYLGPAMVLGQTSRDKPTQVQAQFIPNRQMLWALRSVIREQAPANFATWYNAYAACQAEVHAIGGQWEDLRGDPQFDRVRWRNYSYDDMVSGLHSFVRTLLDVKVEFGLITVTEAVQDSPLVNWQLVGTSPLPAWVMGNLPPEPIYPYPEPPEGEL